MTNENGKSIQNIVYELKSEVSDFLSTRVAMLGAEMRQKADAWKMAAPSVAIGAVLLLTAWLVLTAFLVALVAMAFNAPWNYIIALAIVGAAYLLMGMLIATMGWKKIKETSVVPERTLRILKQDQVWLQTEVKTEL